MTPLEAARKLEQADLTLGDFSPHMGCCIVCLGPTEGSIFSGLRVDHGADCPIPMLPQIIAALEAMKNERDHLLESQNWVLQGDTIIGLSMTAARRIAKILELASPEVVPSSEVLKSVDGVGHQLSTSQSSGNCRL